MPPSHRTNELSPIATRVSPSNAITSHNAARPSATRRDLLPGEPAFWNISTDGRRPRSPYCVDPRSDGHVVESHGPPVVPGVPPEGPGRPKLLEVYQDKPVHTPGFRRQIDGRSGTSSPPSDTVDRPRIPGPIVIYRTRIRLRASPWPTRGPPVAHPPPKPCPRRVSRPGDPGDWVWCQPVSARRGSAQQRLGLRRRRYCARRGPRLRLRDRRCAARPSIRLAMRDQSRPANLMTPAAGPRWGAA